MTDWTPTTDELLAIINRAANRLMLQQPKVDWIPLPWSADNLEPPDAAGFVSVGMIVAVGEPEAMDREVLWHPETQEGRLRRKRS
jgi:hypothetical protein